jgi:cytochrome c oxidase accessory protein FixG
MPLSQHLAPDSDSSVLNLYEKREKIYTRKIEGFYQRVQLFTGWPLLIGYFGLPWLLIEGRQAIFFDLPERKFHIFWMTFWPQDFGLLSWLLMISAFSLFFITTLLGRVWCGYTCPQTVWTAIYMWAEQFAEGDRNRRIKLDQAPWSVEKVARRLLKHGMWFGFAAITGITFVAYFYDMRQLLIDTWQLQLPSTTFFWVAFFTIATYVNAGWMREQVCKYMCPYARFQSAMFDKDTLIVSYNEKRGESRGSRKRSANPVEIGMGDCIDCTFCVQVCPTGIDIRDGLQYECINCARCVDACDSIMDKMGYEKGLIAYTTQNKLDGKGWTWKRSRLIGYAVAILVMVSLFVTILIIRVPLGIDVLRTRGKLFQEVPGGYVQNTYTIKILNMSDDDRVYTLSVSGLEEYRLIPEGEIPVKAGEIGEFSTNILTDPDQLKAVVTPILVMVDSTDGELQAESESRFIGPQPLELEYGGRER